MAKKKTNAFFSKMLTAKNNGAASFVYNGKTYKKSKGKNGIIVYKKAK